MAILVSRPGATAVLEAQPVVLGVARSASRDARVREAVRDHHALVYRLLRRLGVPERDVEDAQQQVFWVFTRNLDRIEAGRDKAFLFGVAVRVAQTVRRRLGRLEPVDDGALENLPSPALCADEELDDRRARAVLDALLEAMPHDLRVVVVLHDLEEWTMRDIATALSVPGGTVASRLRRARELLERLARAGRAERPPAGNEERLLLGLGLGTGAASGLSRVGAAVRTWLRWVGLGLLLGTVSVTSAWAIDARTPRPGKEAGLPRREPIDRDDVVVYAPVLLEGRAFVERQAPIPRILAASEPADELAPIREARLALRRDEAGVALAALKDHARAFPRGVFDEEAAALGVEALAAAGHRDEAHRAADAFDAAYPRSPYGSRVRRALGDPRTP